MTTPALLEEQRSAAGLLREPILRFLERNATREAVKSLEEGELGYSEKHWHDLTTIGCAGLLMPEHVSGTQHGTQIMATVVEMVGSFALPTPMFATAVDAVELIRRAGSAVEQDELLTAIAPGEKLVVAALYEADAAPPADLTDLRTTVEEHDDGWLLSGTKAYVAYANAAVWFLCLARSPDQRSGIFVVPAELSGIERKRMRTTNGDPLYVVSFDDVVVPKSALLGGSWEGWDHYMGMLDVGAGLKCAELLGIGKRVLELTQELVCVRVQFDQPIGAFQAVQHHLADMYRLLEQTRVLTEQAIMLLDNGGAASREVSLAKIKASEGLIEMLNLAQQVHGGVGYYEDYPLETYYRRTMAAQGAYGSAEWHRRRLREFLYSDPRSFRRPDSHELSI
jgi:3-oxocholest-4-en-26-oyl-CoA dehydrogenase beta subunit